MPLIIYRTAALASLSDSLTSITFLFSEWCINIFRAVTLFKIFSHAVPSVFNL